MTDAEVAAARLLLARLGISAEQLIGQSAQERRPVPTFREYIEQVSDAVQPGTRRVYETYWRRVVQAWGDRRLDEPTPLEITQLAEHVKTPSSSGGTRVVGGSRPSTSSRRCAAYTDTPQPTA